MSKLSLFAALALTLPALAQTPPAPPPQGAPPAAPPPAAAPPSAPSPAGTATAPPADSKAAPAAGEAPAPAKECSVTDLEKQLGDLEAAIKAHPAYHHAGGHFLRAVTQLGAAKKSLEAGCKAYMKPGKGPGKGHGKGAAKTH